ncbi:MAG: ATP-binding protein [Thermoanaerobaculia bacterium]
MRVDDLARLLRSGDGYRLLVQSIRDYAVFAMDPEGRVASWNPGAEALLSYGEEEILGKKGACFFTPEDVERGEHEKELRKAVEDGRASDDRWHVRKDGTTFFASGITTSVRDAAGALRGFVKVMRDRTERKHLEEELKNRADALAQADRAKNEFLATLAHELRNPLAPISYALHLLNHEAPTEEEKRRIRGVVERQVKRLTRLVDDLLDVSRINSGKVELRKAWVELSVVVEGAVESSRPLFDSRRHAISVELPPEPVWLEVDAGRLEQVLANLLHNAAKFTEDGGRVYLMAEREPHEVVVRVRDTGVGIPADLLPLIFDLFQQGDRTLDRSHDGLGIGLTLSRKLVELHGGTIEAYSAGIGQGSEFVIRLPAGVAPELEGAAAGEEASPPSAALRVLVVEDNEDTAEMMKILLEMEGHEVEVVHSGPAGVEAAVAFRPDVAVLDIGLPGLDGYQVAQRLRQEPLLTGVELVAASGYGQEDDRQRSREAGFDHHLVKPVDLPELLAILAEVAARRS